MFRTSVPKAPVDEDRQPVRRKDKVNFDPPVPRCENEILTKTQALLMELRSDPSFWRRVLAAITPHLRRDRN
jgi:hypothetical protein